MCENFSDVAESFPALLRPHILFRSADPMFNPPDALGNPKTIINLRFEPDEPRFLNCTYIHCPIANKVEKYDSTQEEVRQWLAEVLRQLSVAGTPILIHCRAGRDRTGIVVAVLLKVLFGDEIADEQITLDYMKSRGRDEELLEMTLQGLKCRITKRNTDWMSSYFRKQVIPVDLLKIKFCVHACSV
ncbi:UNVERIFIED_CONTAM: hypothetical protein HDU68_001586 [Siphonaria sp. JEL0065]|nr:hypothetical protein HDU68_001586 [Siphonaria sp. JEL0065]